MFTPIGSHVNDNEKENYQNLNFQIQKSQTLFCEDNFEENSGEA